MFQQGRCWGQVGYIGILFLVSQDHNCVRELRTLVNTQQQKMGEMQTEILEAKLQLNEQKREIQMLKVLLECNPVCYRLLLYPFTGAIR